MSEISEENRKYNKWVEKQQKIASSIYNLESSINYFDKKNDKDIIKKIKLKLIEIEGELDSENNDLLKTWSSLSKDYSEQFFEFKVRNKKLRIKTFTESLSRLKIPKICLPKYKDYGDILKWLLQENVPGQFPYTSGIFPFKREGEDPLECLQVKVVLKEQIKDFIT